MSKLRKGFDLEEQQDKNVEERSKINREMQTIVLFIQLIIEDYPDRYDEVIEKMGELYKLIIKERELRAQFSFMSHNIDED